MIGTIRTLCALAAGAAVAAGLTGCVVAPTPYGYAPAYGGYGYYAPAYSAYYVPSVSIGIRGGHWR